MNTLFISDLHLSVEHPNLFKNFDAFLNAYTHPNNILYILGDFFDFWVGDDVMTDFHKTVANRLKKATSAGLPIYLMVGNRDFLLGKQFLELAGCQPLPDPFVLNLQNKKILLTHGDMLCVHDKNYLRYRRFVHHPIPQKIFLTLPKNMRIGIAHYLRKQTDPFYQPSEDPITESTVSEFLSKYHADFMIHGHTHFPVQLTNRICLPAWDEHGHVLMTNENRTFQIQEI